MVQDGKTDQDFRDGLLIGASDIPQKNKQIPWQKMCFDRPGILLTVGGEGEISFENHSRKLICGDLVLYDALPRHSFLGVPDWMFYWFHLPCKMFKSYQNLPYNTDVPGVRLAHFERQEFFRIRIEVQEAYLLALQQPPHWERLAELLLQIILVRAFDCIDSGRRNLPSSLSEAVRLLNNFDSEQNMVKLAKLCGMSRSMFFLHFRRQFGCTPMEYRNNLLISRAKKLLVSSPLQIQEIAGILHFKDCYYFSRFFRSQTGQTPSAYRNRHRRSAPEMG
ncbi:helix-turn-helix domain-containing protein [Victivallis sp.]|uniref:helix-turn-helix domain-containing protein n=1 Tax=Victivallis sp. TaxID=2049020 RepID=UPI003A9278FD